MSSSLLLSRVGGACVIGLNRPKALNALNLDMVRELRAIYAAEHHSARSNVVVLRGEGGRAFCAGGDVVSIAKSMGQPASDGDVEPLSKLFFREEYELDNLIARLSVPHVALMNGIVMGGGVGISAHGMYRVCTEKTVFAMPEAAIGFFCDVGGSYLLPRLAYAGLGAYLALTNQRLKGADVCHAGIATHFVAHDALPELVDALGEATHSAAVGDVLDSFERRAPLPEFTMPEAQREQIADAFALDDAFADVYARVRHCDAEWAKRALDSLDSVSPMSLRVIHEQLARGERLGLAECLDMEYRVSQALMADPKSDFFEGVRALLIDKDNKPRWQHASHANIAQDDIERLFDYSVDLPPDLCSTRSSL
jgi:3-hydroxyisobutyryl-CoA hydrolase